MSRIHALLKLARIPNLPTAPADVIAGFLLASGLPRPWRSLGVLVCSSAAIYTAGMILNDVFDIEIDRRERPNRPLPAGEISRATAATCGGLLLAVGVGIAFLASIQSGIVALPLAAAVLAYTGILKNTAIGPIAMGSCRFLNVCLGASIAGSFLDLRYILPAASVGIFIVGVSVLAKKEVQGIEHGRVVAGLCLTLLSAGLLAVAWLRGMPGPMAFWVPFGCFAIVSAAAYSLLIPSDTKVNIGTVIRAQLRLLIVLDAAIAGAAGGWGGVAAVMALLVPALILDRSFAAT